MDWRTGSRIATAAAIGVAAYSGTGGFFPKLFRSIGWIEWASSIQAGVVLIASLDIQWGAIYRLIFFVSVPVVVALQWNFLSAPVRAWWKQQQRECTEPACGAIIYMANHSVLAARQEYRSALPHAFEAFITAARNGDLMVRGRKPGKYKLERIPRRVWEKGVIDRESCDDKWHGEGGKLVSREDKTAVLYVNLLVNHERVREIWPEDRSYRGAGY